MLLESLLDLLHGCLLLPRLTLWMAVRYTKAQLFLVGAEHEPRWSPSRFFLLLPLPGRPAQVPALKDEGCNGFLYTYLATLLYCFIVSNSFLMRSLQFLHEESCHLQKDKYTFTFPVWMPFISASCLSSLARTPVVLC